MGGSLQPCLPVRRRGRSLVRGANGFQTVRRGNGIHAGEETVFAVLADLGYAEVFRQLSHQGGGLAPQAVPLQSGDSVVQLFPDVGHLAAAPVHGQGNCDQLQRRIIGPLCQVGGTLPKQCLGAVLIHQCQRCRGPSLFLAPEVDGHDSHSAVVYDDILGVADNLPHLGAAVADQCPRLDFGISHEHHSQSGQQLVQSHVTTIHYITLGGGI